MSALPDWMKARYVTVEEYLDFEQHSEERHEYFDGYLFGMAGASDTHEMIALNLAAALHAHLRGKACKVFKDGMRLRTRINDRELYYYPDVMVACDPADNDRHHRERPTFIAEVLSEDEHRDLVEKYLAYQRVPSVEEYLVISQNPARPEVRMFRRREDWKMNVTLRTMEEAFTIESVGLTLKVGDLYAS